MDATPFGCAPAAFQRSQGRPAPQRPPPGKTPGNYPRWCSRTGWGRRRRRDTRGPPSSAPGRDSIRRRSDLGRTECNVRTPGPRTTDSGERRRSGGGSRQRPKICCTQSPAAVELEENAVTVRQSTAQFAFRGDDLLFGNHSAGTEQDGVPRRDDLREAEGKPLMFFSGKLRPLA